MKATAYNSKQALSLFAALLLLAQPLSAAVGCWTLAAAPCHGDCAAGMAAHHHSRVAVQVSAAESCCFIVPTEKDPESAPAKLPKKSDGSSEMAEPAAGSLLFSLPADGSIAAPRGALRCETDRQSHLCTFLN